MAINKPQMSFAGGVIHPLYIHRDLDMEPFAFGLRQSVNGIVLETGAWTRRPGTYYVAGTKSNYPAYLVRWEYNKSTAYVLEFTPLKLRFFQDHAPVESGAVVYEIDTPFTADELPYLQAEMESGKEVMRIVTGERDIYKLTRIAEDNWTLVAAGATTGPFADTNTDEGSTVAVDTVGKPGTTVVVTAAKSIFSETRVGSVIRIDGTKPEATINETWSTTDDTEIGPLEGASDLLVPINSEWTWSINIEDTWVDSSELATGSFQLEWSEDGVTWAEYRIISLPEEFSVTSHTIAGIPYQNLYAATLKSSNTTNKTIYVRIKLVSFLRGDATGSAIVRSSFKVASSDHSGVVELTSYTSATEMGGEIVTEPVSTVATRKWAFGAVDAVSGYPRAFTMKDTRGINGGTTLSPVQINASQAYEPDNYTTGMEDDDGFSYTLTIPANRINWLNGSWRDVLTMGTEKGIVLLTPAVNGGFTPTNPPTVYRSLAVPTSRVQPQMIEDVLLVIGGDGNRQLLQVFWSEERGGIIADLVTKYASHVGLGGFDGLAVQTGDQNLLWLPVAGRLAGCTYRPNMPAWHTHELGDEVVSVCTAPTTAGEELWLCVRRGTDYFIEYMDQIDLDREVEDSHFVDCGVAWDGGDPATVVSITQADPATLTLAAWPQDSTGTDLAVGDYVRIVGYDDMAYQIFKVKACNSGTKTLTLYDQSGAVDIDGTSFTAYVSGATLEWVKNSVAGMGHLAGETLLALCDGKEVACTGAEPITFGTDVQDFYNTVHVGVEVEAILETLPPEFYLRTGSTIGNARQVGKVVLSLYRSFGGQYGATGANPQDIPYKASELTDGLFTGKRILGPTGGVFRGEMTLTLPIGGAYPFTIRGIATDVEVY